MPKADKPHDFGDFTTLAAKGGQQGIAAYFDATTRRWLACQLKSFREQKGLSLEDVARQMLTTTADESNRPFNGPVTVERVAQAIKEFEQCLWFPSILWVQRLSGAIGFRLGFTLMPRNEAADHKHFEAIQVGLLRKAQKNK